MADISYWNTTWFHLHHDRLDVQPAPAETTGSTRRFVGALTGSWPSAGSIAIQADRLVVETGDSRIGHISRAAPNMATTVDSGQGVEHAWSGWIAESDKPQVVAEVIRPSFVHILATNITRLELHGGQLECARGYCPTGGTLSTSTTGDITVTQRNFERLAGDLGAGVVLGAPARIRLGGETLDMNGDGRLRLPGAITSAECDCTFDGEATLSMQGEFSLDQVRPSPDGRLQAHLTSSGDAYRDQLPVALTAGTAAGAAAFGLASVALVVKLVFGLFTRLSKEQALEHPKRQKIFQYIQQHPGANFREVARETDIAAGTVRHHLTVLERAGHVVEHQHQGTVRLFENHGKFDHNWSDMVLLREPALAELHLWLKQNPGSPQKDVLEAMEALGWSRSTTQHRLTRLVEGGLATIRLQGRLKLYTGTEKSAPRPVGAAALMPVGSLAS